MNYILYGEQYPMIRKRLTKILDERLGKPDDFNVVKIDYDESSIDEVISECSLLPLGYERKAVVVDNASFITKDVDEETKKKFLECIKNSGDEIDIILILRSEKIDQKSEIVNEIKDHGKIFEFLNLKPEEWPVYIKKYFNDRDVEISTDAALELAARVDGDLLRFINEADKLCLYKNKIEISDIVLMVSKPLEDDAFKITNMLLKGDNETALSVYKDLKLLGSKSVETIIPMLATQFRFISEVAYLDSQGLDINQIADELAVKDIRVKIALKNCRYLSKRQIAHAIDDLYNLDYQIKSGQIDRFYGFELFLINFPN